MNGLNIGLDLLFVLHFDWGVPGVAWATFIAEWGGLTLGLWLCRDAFVGTAWRNVDRVFDRARLINMGIVNSDILIRSVLLQAIFVSFLFWGADFGDVNLATNQILLQFLHVKAFALDGFAAAAESLVGQALGAKKRSTITARRTSYKRLGGGNMCRTRIGICRGRSIHYRHHDHRTRRPSNRPQLPALHGCSAHRRGGRMDVRRYFHRGNAVPRHA